MKKAFYCFVILLCKYLENFKLEMKIAFQFNSLTHMIVVTMPRVEVTQGSLTSPNVIMLVAQFTNFKRFNLTLILYQLLGKTPKDCVFPHAEYKELFFYY